MPTIDQLQHIRHELPLSELWGRTDADTRCKLFPVLAATVDALIENEESNAYLNSRDHTDTVDAGHVWRFLTRPATFRDVRVWLGQLVDLNALVTSENGRGETVYRLSRVLAGELTNLIEEPV